MKTQLRSSVVSHVCGIALLSLFTAHAQGPWLYTPFYVKADFGGTFTQDTDLKEFFGENTSGARVKFDPGFRLGFTGGLLVTDWFAAELETGVMERGIDSITGPSSVDATLSQVPFLLNARFQFPNESRFRPYLGGGLGVAAAVLDAGHIDFGMTQWHGSQSDAVFAYQAFAGLRYALNDRAGVCLEYHYFGTSAPEWRVDSRYGVFPDRMSFGRIDTHAFSIAFDYRF